MKKVSRKKSGRPRTGIKKKRGIWVFTPGEPVQGSVTGLIDRERDKRICELSK